MVIQLNYESTADDYIGAKVYDRCMSDLSLAISVITYRRSQLLNSCLQSLYVAMSDKRYPIYIVIQDADKDDLAVLNRHAEMITEIIYVDSEGKDVEELINNNRIRAWEVPLIERGHHNVICLEDDVEVSPDIFEFTEHVLEQTANSRNFWGINYGSFEKPNERGTYSKLRYGLHGPASLINKRSFERFKLRQLKKFRGSIPWDAWVEPLVRTGFMATSNVSRYRDNGQIGTHASFENDSAYFENLNESFDHGLLKSAAIYYNSDIEHQWRADCIIYKEKGKVKNYFKFVVVRCYQIFNALF